MIGRLVQTVQNPDTSSCLRCGREYSQREILLVHYLGTTERKYQPAVRYLGNRSRIKSLVCSESVFQSASMFGESRRIHYHQIKFPFFRFFQIVYRITTQPRMRGSIEAVENDIPVHQFHTCSPADPGKNLFSDLMSSSP